MTAPTPRASAPAWTSPVPHARLLVPLLMITGLMISGAVGCSDYDVTKGVPELEISAERIDFGEVIVGYRSTIGVELRNTGTADLVIEESALDGTTSPDFGGLDLSDTVVPKGGSVELSVSYTPDALGQDYGNVELWTDHPDQPLVGFDLAGFGVVPELDLDPELLWFGEVAVGDSVTRSFELSVRGTGALVVESLELGPDIAGTYTVTLPGGVAPPLELSAGTSLEAVVTFEPVDDGEQIGELIVRTNAPGYEEEPVTLYGNTAEDPGGNNPPVVSISSPDAGAYLLLDDVVEIRGSVVDEEDPPESLACLAYAGSSPIGTGFPDSDGLVAFPATGLPAGAVRLTLRCLDSEGLSGEDDVDVQVWDPEEPIEYALSGGTTPFDWLSVDDDLHVYVDGTLVWADENHTKDTHPPILLDAEIGQTVRVVVTDYNHCDTMLSPLTLHFGLEAQQSVSDGYCRSACPDHECFDPDYDGPWPGAEWELEFEVEIPR